MTSILNQLADNPGARTKKTLLGRGIGSGKGKTSGRGGKGQTARTGVAINGFEGGQTPIHRRLPKRGFNNPTRKEYEIINVETLQDAVQRGKLAAGKPVTLDALRASGLLKGLETKVKLLGNGTISTAVQVEVNAASPSAIAAVEKAGGKVTILAKAPAAAKKDAPAKKEKVAPAKKTAKKKGS